MRYITLLTMDSLSYLTIFRSSNSLADVVTDLPGNRRSTHGPDFEFPLVLNVPSALGSTQLPNQRYRTLLLLGKVAGTCRQPLVSIRCRGKKSFKLNLHSRQVFTGVLNYRATFIDRVTLNI